ncbi:MAG TPA: hypothetical protein VFW03_19160 [Gemmatimonadaceae bacterium]|nr:hypothetical protein [Gemmatimonadaceae bacterium]
MMPPLVVLAARSMWFWLLVAALVCTVITEWLRWWRSESPNARSSCCRELPPEKNRVRI